MTRPADPIWDALVHAFGYSASMTTIERGRLNKVCKELREAGATPEEIKRRYGNYAKVMPDGCMITPLALAANWTLCGTVKADESREKRIARTQAEEAEFRQGVKPFSELKREAGC